MTTIWSPGGYYPVFLRSDFEKDWRQRLPSPLCFTTERVEGPILRVRRPLPMPKLPFDPKPSMKIAIEYLLAERQVFSYDGQRYFCYVHINGDPLLYPGYFTGFDW